LGSARQHQTHDTKSEQNEFFHRSPLSGMSGLGGRIYIDRGSFFVEKVSDMSTIPPDRRS
jgi:hypothetical protein